MQEEQRIVSKQKMWYTWRGAYCTVQRDLASLETVSAPCQAFTLATFLTKGVFVLDYHELLNLSADIGRLLLQNGAEIYRVEESMERFFAAYGVSGQVYCVPTTIIATILTPEGENISKGVRVRSRGTDFDKVMAVNDLCRRVCREKPELSAVREELSKIPKRPVYSLPLTCLGWALVGSTFALIFGGNFFDAACAFPIGVLVCLLQFLLNKLEANQFFSLMVESFLIGTLAILSVKLGLAGNADKVIIGVLMNLVPGIALTNCIRDILAGDLMSGVAKIAEVFLIAVFIALGAVMAVYGARLIPGL